MRIAVPFDKAAGTIAEQFDRTEAFRLYNLENGQIVSSLSLPAFGTGNEAMAEFLKTARADVVICGGITARGRQLLGSEGIAVYPGFGGSADDAAQAFAAGSLSHGEGHDCAHCTQDCSHHGHEHRHE